MLLIFILRRRDGDSPIYGEIAMAKVVRMVDIAQKLGVSTVTVSKALAEQKGVSEEMREKIKKLAEEMGYKPPSANRKEKKNSYNVGVLVAETYIERYATFYWEFYQAIITAAAKVNCFVLLEVLEVPDENTLPDVKLITENKVDGLIVLGSISSDYLLKLKQSYSLPLVFMDFYDNKLREDCVISNSFYGTYQLTNYLFDKGHEKIAFVGTVLATDSITDRYLGYQKSLMEHGYQIYNEWVIPDRDERRRVFENIELPEYMPTAFVCNSDLTASNLIRILQEKGLRVPKDISVVGYDDYLHPGLCDVGITTYSVDMERMAQTGISIMVKKMSGKAYHAGIHVVEGVMVERESVAQR